MRTGMPSPQVITAELAQIANRAFALAVAIHLVLGLIGVAYALGARPTRGAALLLVSTLFGTVGMVAFTFHNPFNASTFGLLSIAYAFTALSWRGQRERREEIRWARGIGWSMLVFGWTYPHFLEQSSPFAYLIGAPLGLLPCPTLAFVAGLSLTRLVPVPAALSLLVAVTGLFYGLFGMLRLGVLLDGALLLGALALLFQELRVWHRGRRPRGTTEEVPTIKLSS
jgi:hypothetical protein